MKKKKVGSHLVSPSMGWAGLASCHSQMPLSPNATATSAQVAFGGWRLRQGRLAVTFPSLAESREPPYFWDDGNQPITLMGFSASSAPQAPQDHTTLTLCKKGSWGLEQDGMWTWKLPQLGTGCSPDWVFQNR